jgi:mediator of RNA polymerase II transcription subunit 12
VAPTAGKAYTGDVPTSAKIYPQGTAADYFPWLGSHSEDILSEPIIKSGYQNKPPIANETNTARPSLWSHLKTKTGPHSLSNAFVALFERRQTTGRITGPTSFKPPPRWAMSASKKESFLRELADPAYPMRKLNRSVPHSLSGRTLLDQCLARFIPTTRAVWLAKCIGANDIRGFKRKLANPASAAGNEAKYVRDWTVQVEQFIRAVLTNVGEADWKAKVDYVLRFSSHLFSEQLLDQDHFLDWVVMSLETAPLEQLPIWLLLLQIFWKPLLSSRKRGARIATGLLVHLQVRTPS